jgi:peptidoglycan/xylan/chitin deacetylase (PgdA/CDA1 family)
MRRSLGWLALFTLFAEILFTPFLAKADYMIATHGDRKKRQIAITMDDCGKHEYVQQMLDLCDEYNFKMTFFPIGNKIDETEAEDWRRLVESGHEIGNHTNKHANLTKRKSLEKVQAEMTDMENRLNDVLGYEYDIKLMRPPFGSIFDPGMHTAKRLDMCGYHYIILWSVSETNSAKMLNKVQNGDILLYHSYKKDVDGLRKAIPILLERGYELVTVSQLLGLD